MIIRLCSLHDLATDSVSMVIKSQASPIALVQKITHLGVVAGI
jgi:hypothetical protein